MSVKKTRQEKLRDKIEVTQLELLDILSGLECGQGEMCHCNRDLGTVNIVHQGSFFNEIMIYCLSCGGLVEHE